SASITGSANGIYKPTSTNSRFGSTGASTRSTPSVRCSASLATQRRRPMPSFIPATGITLHLEGECVNRIGVRRTTGFLGSNAPVRSNYYILFSNIFHVFVLASDFCAKVAYIRRTQRNKE